MFFCSFDHELNIASRWRVGSCWFGAAIEVSAVLLLILGEDEIGFPYIETLGHALDYVEFFHLRLVYLVQYSMHQFSRSGNDAAYPSLSLLAVEGKSYPEIG
jgi:hypothetical protein